MLATSMPDTIATPIPGFTLRRAAPDDCGVLLGFIRELAAYERLSHLVSADETRLRAALFGERPVAEAVLGLERDRPAGFAVWFHNFSTFLGRPGLYLEDLYVSPACRGRGYGATMLRWLAKLAVERGCGRFEWSVLDWNEPALAVYRSLGAESMSDWTVQRVSGDALERLASAFDRPRQTGQGARSRGCG